MSVRIRVRNFQSIEDAEVEVSGLTVVTGQNNSGKTAMVRAVRGVFENSGGDAFVRHGTDALAVHLDFGDTDITWTKGPKVKPTYVIGGKTINPGRAVPDEVRSLGVQPVQAGSGEVWPQIAPQFTGQMFLLDMPGSAIAEVVSDVDRVSKLTEALRYADSDKRSANADLKIRRKDRDDAQAEVQRFDGLDAAADVWATACAARDAVQAVANELDDARAVAERLAVAQARVAALEGVCRVLVPVTQPVVDASAKVAIVRRLASVVRQHRDAIALLPADVPVPSAEDAHSHATAVAQVTQIRTRLRAAQTTIAALPVDVVVPAIGAAPVLFANIQTLRSIVRRLDTARAAVSRYEGVSATLPDSTSVNRIGSAIATLKQMQSRVEAARSSARSLEDQLDVAIKDRDMAQDELDAVIVEVGACPTCGSASTGEVAHRH